jgi:hypothetical protein
VLQALDGMNRSDRRPMGEDGDRTVEGDVPTRRAISRVGLPVDFDLIISRTQRIASLFVSIRSPFAKPKGGTRSEREEASSPRATSSRNGGRNRAESAISPADRGCSGEHDEQRERERERERETNRR